MFKAEKVQDQLYRVVNNNLTLLLIKLNKLNISAGPPGVDFQPFFVTDTNGTTDSCLKEFGCDDLM